MKKHTWFRAALAVLAALIAVTALASCGKKVEHAGYKLAAGEADDFDFYVPQSWTVSMTEGTVAAYCSAADPSSISLMPGELEHADSTPDDWWATYESEFSAVYDDYNLIETKDDSLGGTAAKTYVFSGKLLDTEYHFEITAAVRSGRIYMLTFTSTPDNYENHADTLADVTEFVKFH